MKTIIVGGVAEPAPRQGLGVLMKTLK